MRDPLHALPEDSQELGLTSMLKLQSFRPISGSPLITYRADVLVAANRTKAALAANNSFFIQSSQLSRL